MEHVLFVIKSFQRGMDMIGICLIEHVILLLTWYNTDYSGQLMELIIAQQSVLIIVNFLSLIVDVFLSKTLKLNVSPLVSLMKPVDVNPNDEWVNVCKHSPMQ